MVTRFPLLCALLAAGTWTTAYGESLPALQTGMMMHEVIRAAGPAKEKMMYETKREERWHYERFSVVFREGRLAIFQPADVETHAEGESEAQRLPAHEDKETQLSPPALTQLWSELQATSTEETTAKAAPAAPPQQQAPSALAPQRFLPPRKE